MLHQRFAAAARACGQPPARRSAESQAYAELAWMPPAAAVASTRRVEVQHVGRIYVNDRNTDFAPAYTIANLRVGWRSIVGAGAFSQFVRVNNVADRNYVGSVIVGDTNGRFFEPAPGRNWFVGASVESGCERRIAAARWCDAAVRTAVRRGLLRHRRSAKLRRSTLARRRRHAQSAEEMHVTIKLSMTVNGKAVTASVDPRTLLVEFLREHLNLTGTHVGCDTGQCGACTIHLDGRAVKSCMLLAAQANGAKITTIEGIATQRRAASDAGGVQANATACNAASARRAW